MNGTAIHDVVIAGAGPAGSCAGRLLAAAGCRVVLLDAAAAGRDKPCGGGLTPRAYHRLELDLDPIVRARIHRGEVRFGDQTVGFDLGDDAVWMVCRREFDNHLAEAAQAAGAELHHRERVVSAEVDAGLIRVRTVRQTYRSRVLLVATGGEAIPDVGVARPPSVMAPALEIEAPGRSGRLDSRAVVFDFATANGYAWAFPKGELWNVGVLTRSEHPGVALRRRLEAALRQWDMRFDGELAVRAVGRRLPMHKHGQILHSGRVALIGDAAALADPFFGEGLAAALGSGSLSAAAAFDVLAGKSDDLGGYSLAIKAEFGRHLNRARWTARLMYAAPRATVSALQWLPTARALARQFAIELPPQHQRVNTSDPPRPAALRDLLEIVESDGREELPRQPG
jgi:geranylgeranyl reductase family protein